MKNYKITTGNGVNQFELHSKIKGEYNSLEEAKKDFETEVKAVSESYEKDIWEDLTESDLCRVELISINKDGDIETVDISETYVIR